MNDRHLRFMVSTRGCLGNLLRDTGELLDNISDAKDMLQCVNYDKDDVIDSLKKVEDTGIFGSLYVIFELVRNLGELYEAPIEERAALIEEFMSIYVNPISEHDFQALDAKLDKMREELDAAFDGDDDTEEES